MDIIIILYCFLIPAVHVIAYVFDDTDDFLHCRSFIEYLHCDNSRLNTFGIIVKRVLNSFCYVYYAVILALIKIIEMFIYIYNFIFYKKEN